LANNQINEENNSFRFRFSANGNRIIPFYQASSTDEYIPQVRFITQENKRFDRLSNSSINNSMDGRKFMTLETSKINKFKIYNENGSLLETISNYDLARFTPNGSLLFTKGRQVSLRDSAGLIRHYYLSQPAHNAFSGTESKFIVAELKNQVSIINTDNGLKTIFNEKLIDLNFNKKVFITLSFGKEENGKKAPDTIKRRDISGSGLIPFNNGSGIQALKYCPATDEILLLTTNDHLLLLNSELKIKAGFQLTPNDLFGFSDDGKRIYYVRNDFISVFSNDNKLINFFDFEASLKWTQHVKGAKKALREDGKKNRALRKKYHLEFQQKFF
jgi:hypothetical protein